ncbi:MAG: hypothetical protein WC695_10290 [Candidatus Omnitrophota bacterium]
MKPKFVKILSIIICLLLSVQQTGFAQVASSIDIAGRLSGIRNSFLPDSFHPLHLRYLAYTPGDDSFRFLLDKGSLSSADEQELESASKQLFQYFLTGLSLPNDSFWVNLRPDEEDNIIDLRLAQTDAGRIMLESDLQLKKDTARFTSPETAEGRLYWDKLYKRAAQLYGSDNVTIPTLTRPWIVPAEIIIRETADSAYIYKATLKVQLEQDHLKDSQTYDLGDPRASALNEYSSQLIRELILPKLTREVNSSKAYACLRQVYYSLVLAQWFKKRYAGEENQYSKRIDTGDLAGIKSGSAWSKTAYFNAYKRSFSEGEYNLKEPVHSSAGQSVRSYFSGGEILEVVIPSYGQAGAVTSIVSPRASSAILGRGLVRFMGRVLLAGMVVTGLSWVSADAAALKQPAAAHQKNITRKEQITQLLRRDIIDLIMLIQNKKDPADISLKKRQVLDKARAINVQFSELLSKVLVPGAITTQSEYDEIKKQISLINEQFLVADESGFYMEAYTRDNRILLLAYSIERRENYRLTDGSQVSVLYVSRLDNLNFEPAKFGHNSKLDKFVVVLSEATANRAREIAGVLKGDKYYASASRKFLAHMENLARVAVKKDFSGKSEAEIKKILDWQVELHELGHKQNDLSGAAEKLKGFRDGKIINEIIAALVPVVYGPAPYIELLDIIEGIAVNTRMSYPSAVVVNEFARELGAQKEYTGMGDSATAIDLGKILIETDKDTLRKTAEKILRKFSDKAGANTLDSELIKKSVEKHSSSPMEEKKGLTAAQNRVAQALEEAFKVSEYAHGGFGAVIDARDVLESLGDDEESVQELIRQVVMTRPGFPKADIGKNILEFNYRFKKESFLNGADKTYLYLSANGEVLGRMNVDILTGIREGKLTDIGVIPGKQRGESHIGTFLMNVFLSELYKKRIKTAKIMAEKESTQFYIRYLEKELLIEENDYWKHGINLRREAYFDYFTMRVDHIIGKVGSSSPVSSSQRQEAAGLFNGTGAGRLGGIDFRALPIVTQAMVNLKACAPGARIDHLRGVNLNDELKQMRQLVDARVCVSSDRVKEYVQALSFQGADGRSVDGAVSFIADMLKVQEGNYEETDPLLRDILVILDTIVDPQDLERVFSGNAQ